jgi:hypothetical protein
MTAFIDLEPAFCKRYARTGFAQLSARTVQLLTVRRAKRLRADKILSPGNDQRATGEARFHSVEA